MNHSNLNIEVERNNQSLILKATYFSLFHIIMFGFISFSLILVFLYFVSISYDELLLNFLFSLICFPFSILAFFEMLKRLKNYRKFYVDSSVLKVSIEPIKLFSQNPQEVPVREIKGFFFDTSTDRNYNVTMHLYADLGESELHLTDFENENQLQAVIDTLDNFLNIESKDRKRE